MNCLLCDDGAQPLRRIGPDLWSVQCTRCGEYHFDGRAACWIQHAKAYYSRDVLAQLPALAHQSRHAFDANSVLTLGLRHTGAEGVSVRLHATVL